MKLKIVCSATENYMDNIKPYLQSLHAVSVAENILVTVHFKPDQEYIENYRRDIQRIQWTSITKEQNDGAPAGTWSIQHGSFVPLVSNDDDDVLIYTDGDMRMQRQITRAEQGWMEAMPHGMVAVSWNSGPDEKLIHEAARLSPRTRGEEFVSQWGAMVETEPCFNIGVLIAKASTWKMMYERYMRLYPKALECFGHMARQQWLMCYVMADLKLNRWVMPYSWHTHNHYGMPAGVVLNNGVAIYEDRVILFRHHF